MVRFDYLPCVFLFPSWSLSFVFWFLFWDFVFFVFWGFVLCVCVVVVVCSFVLFWSFFGSRIQPGFTYSNWLVCLKSLLTINSLYLLLSSCVLFVEKAGYLCLRIYCILDFADWHPLVSFNVFLFPLDLLSTACSRSWHRKCSINDFLSLRATLLACNRMAVF